MSTKTQSNGSWTCWRRRLNTLTIVARKFWRTCNSIWEKTSYSCVPFTETPEFSTYNVTHRILYKIMDNLWAFIDVYLCCLTGTAYERRRPRLSGSAEHVTVTHWFDHTDLSIRKTVFVVGLAECIKWMYEKKCWLEIPIVFLDNVAEWRVHTLSAPSCHSCGIR